MIENSCTTLVIHRLKPCSLKMTNPSEDPFPLIQEGNLRISPLTYSNSCTECKKTHHCHPFVEKLEKCTQRVEEDANTDENCVEEFFDMMVSF